MDIYAVQASAHVWDAFLFFQIAFKTRKNKETKTKKKTHRDPLQRWGKWRTCWALECCHRRFGRAARRERQTEVDGGEKKNPSVKWKRSIEFFLIVTPWIDSPLQSIALCKVQSHCGRCKFRICSGQLQFYFEKISFFSCTQWTSSQTRRTASIKPSSFCEFKQEKATYLLSCVH